MGIGRHRPLRASCGSSRPKKGRRAKRAKRTLDRTYHNARGPIDAQERTIERCERQTARREIRLMVREWLDDRGQSYNGRPFDGRAEVAR